MVSLGLAVQRGAIKEVRLRTAIPKAAKLTSVTANPPTMVKPMASMVVMVSVLTVFSINEMLGCPLPCPVDSSL